MGRKKITQQKRAAPKTVQEFRNYRSSGASLVNKALLDINTFLRSADEDISDNLDVLKARSRELSMGNSLGIAAIKRIRTNTVGIGLKLKSTIDHELLGLDAKEAEKIERLLETMWEFWAESVECDFNRMKNFYQLQSLAMATKLVDGECFVVMPFKKNIGEAFELKIRFLDSTKCVSPNETDTESIIKGVEIDRDGAPQAYYFGKDKENTETVRVPIFGKLTGRRNVLHVFDLERIGQKRGVPLLAPIIEELHQITKVGRAELKNIAVSTIFTAFIKNQSTETMLKGASKLGDVKKGEIPTIEFDSGNFGELAPGQDVVYANPNRQYTPLDTFIEAIVKKAGAGIGIPHDVLISHFNKSYSASRAALNEAWTTYLVHRENFLTDFCKPIYAEFVDYLVDENIVELPGYRENLLKRMAYLRSEWIGSSPGQIDPVKEVKATAERLRLGITTKEKEMKALGLGDYEKIQIQLKKELENDLELEEIKREARQGKGGETSVVVASGKEKE